MVATIQLPKRSSTLGDVSLGRASQQTGAKVQAAGQTAASAFRETAGNMIVQHDKSRTGDAFNEFREDARNEYFRLSSMKGNNAIGVNSVTQQYNTWYDEKSSEISDGLDNIEQQNNFRILSDRRKQSDLDSLSAHEATQSNAYTLSVHRGEISNAQADTISFFNNDAKMEDVENSLRLSFETTFPGFDTTEAEQKEIASIRSLRIKMLSENGNVDKARELLESSKDELKGAYLPLKELVDQQDIVEQSQTEADRIMATVQGEGAQLKEARAITDSEVRDATLSRVKTYQQDNQRIANNNKQKQSDDITNEAIDLFRAGGTKTQFDSLVDKTRDPDTRKELLRLSNYYYPDPKDPKPVKTDFLKFIDAQKSIDLGLQQGSPISDEKLIRTYQPFMTASDMEELIKYSKNGGNIGDMSKADADRWFKFYTEKKPEERPEAYGTYWNYLKDQLEPGKKPTTDDYKKWSDEWFTSEGVTPDGGFAFFDLSSTRAKSIKKGVAEGFKETTKVISPGITEIKPPKKTRSLRATQEPETLPDGTIVFDINAPPAKKRDPLGIRGLIGK